jgi:SpoIID/LytB domain protein
MTIPMPAEWPAEALRSQAVVARSYALTSRRPSEPFDVYADTSIARTLFHSS